MDDSSRREKKQWQAQQRSAARAAFPLTSASLQNLFDSVEDQLEQEPCDHTLRLTEAWLASNGHTPSAVVRWLRDHGGYCDCEVVTNVGDHWEQTAGRPPRVKLAVSLLPTARGGRSTSVCLRAARWRPHLRVAASSEWLGVAFVAGPAELEPGSEGVAIAELVYTETGVDYGALQPGIVADILEGRTVVGSARVLARWDS